MIVDRNDIDTRGAQRLQNRLKLWLQHHEVAIDHRLLIAPDKSCPGIDTHRVSNLMSTHLSRAPDGDFVNSARYLTFHPHYAFNIFGIEGGFRRIEIGFGYFTFATARVLDFRKYFSDCRSELLLIAHATDVHEHDFGRIPEKMVVQRCHFKAII